MPTKRFVKLCSTCGAEYEHEADYCNVCRSESLEEVEIDLVPAALDGPSLQNDGPSLAIGLVIWVGGLAYLLGERSPRSLGPVLSAWALLFVVGAILGVILRNSRMFALLAAIGLLAVLLYAAVRL